MKTICLIAILVFALKVVANDTLTRAQVYNFNVGDTFDYKNAEYSYCSASNNGPGSSDSFISYFRYVIANISYSLDSSIKYIQSELVYPSPFQFDTMMLVNLSDYEVYLDSTPCTPGFGPPSIIIEDTSWYHGRICNIITPYGCFSSSVFADGLGLILHTRVSGGLGCYGSYSVALIYYSKGSETWGTPYYNFPTGISELSTDETQITLSPTVNNGAFNIKVTDASLLPVSIMIYDVAGREVKRTALNNADNNMNIAPCCAGMYIWKAVTHGQLIKTGKMVVH